MILYLKGTQVLGFFTNYLKNDFLKQTKYTAPLLLCISSKGGGALDCVRTGKRCMRI